MLAHSAWAAEPTRKSVRGTKTKHPPIPAAAEIVDLVAAKAAFQDGLRAFNLGLWDDAIAGFQRSYRLSGDAALLFNVAQAQRQAGHRKEALVAYKAYLRENPETPHRELVQAKIQDLEASSPAVTSPPTETKTSGDQLTGILENPFEPLARETSPELVRPESVPLVGSDPTVAGALPAAPTAVIPPAAPAAPMTPAPLVQTETSPQQDVPANPVASRWWLWTGIGAAVVAGVVTAVILSTRAQQRDSSCPPGFDGCLPVGK